MGEVAMRQLACRNSGVHVGAQIHANEEIATMADSLSVAPWLIAAEVAQRTRAAALS